MSVTKRQKTRGRDVPADEKPTLADVERQALLTALREEGSVAKAALRLKLSRQGVYLKLERHGIVLTRAKCAACGRLKPGKVPVIV